MMGRCRTPRLLGSIALIGLAASACSGKTTQAGGIELIIASNLQTPTDFDSVTLQVQQQAAGGAFGTAFVQGPFMVGADFTLPTTFAIAAGESPDQSVLIELIALKNGVAVDVREVEVQVPTTRVAELTLILAESCLGQVTTAGGQVQPKCPVGQSCQPASGTCGSNLIPTPENDYDPSSANSVDASVGAFFRDAGADATVHDAGHGDAHDAGHGDARDARDATEAGCTATTDCGAGSCNGTTFTSPGACGASGACVRGESVTCAAPTPVCTASSGCVQCGSASDCAETGNFCQSPACTTNTCGSQNVASGTALPDASQTSGTCQKVVCNGDAGTTSVDDPTNLPPPASTVCLSPACSGEPLAPSAVPVEAGTSCTADHSPPSAICGTPDGGTSGKCVECNAAADCAADCPAGTTCACTANHCSATFSDTEAAQAFTVPPGVTHVTIAAFGATGGGSGCTNPVNAGATTATIAVMPGEVLAVYVGGSGSTGAAELAAPAGGFNGGGAGGINTATPGLTTGGGGGASDVRQGGGALSNRVVVAGGSGGAAAGNGGLGGGPTGGNGGMANNPGSATGGLGGTASAGGTGGTAGTGGTDGATGALGMGGAGATGDGCNCESGGGGGGGYYGGGGGGGYTGCAGAGGGGGAGGSSFAVATATDVTLTQGSHSGSGQVVITW